MQGISLIMPAYNEADIIYRTVCESARVLESIGSSYEIIVVDDGSIDDTALEAGRAAREFPGVKLVRLSDNQGKGNALRRGFQVSRYELVCFLDADLDLHPSLIGKLLEVMDESGADIVIGSKRHPESQLSYPRLRRIYSTVYYWLIFALFHLPVKDTQTGIKVFRREVLENTFPRLVIKRYALDLELLAAAHHLGYSVAEAPVNLDFQRISGRIKWDDVRNIIVDTMAVFYRLRILKYYSSPLKGVIEREPSITVVIPCAVPDALTNDCLRKCENLNYSNYDIELVCDSVEGVDMGPAPPGSEVVGSGPTGPPSKRNLGVSRSDAEIVAFLDADAWPDYDWLKNAVPYFEDAGVAAVGGPAVTPPGDTRRQQASGLVYAASIVSGSTAYRYVVHAYRNVDDYPSANLLVRRSDFEQAGGFREEYLTGSDTLLCLKLTHDLGKKILYVPNVMVNHHRRPVYRAHLKQIYSYSTHRGYFVRKYPATSRRAQYFIPSLFVAFVVLGLIASFFSQYVLYAYVSILGLYLLTVLASSIKSLDPLVNLMVFPAIIATNFVYGIGFIRGLVSRGLKEH